MRKHTLIIAVAAAAMFASGATSEPATAATVGTAAKPGACQPAWHLMPTPAAPNVTAPSSQGTQDGMTSVSPVSAHEVMFGGYLSGLQGGTPWTLGWNGGSFTEPAQVSESPFMSAFAGGGLSSYDSASDGWVFPSQVSVAEENPDVVLAEHWHDGNWSMEPMAVSPDPATLATVPRDVVAVSPSDAWAVGGLYHVGADASNGPAGALIERWDGTQWSAVPNPAQAQDGTDLWGLSVRSPDDIWAVGEQNASSYVPFAEHWDGTAWHVVPVPATGAQQSFLMHVSADGPDDAWAVGNQTAPSGSYDPYAPFVEHWDGTAWHIVTLPSTGSAEEWWMAGVYAASSSDVWVSSPALSDGSAFLHWDGKAWSTVPVPGPQLRTAYHRYTAMAGTGPDDVWAVGSFTTLDQGLQMPLIAHLSCG